MVIPNIIFVLLFVLVIILILLHRSNKKFADKISVLEQAIDMKSESLTSMRETYVASKKALERDKVQTETIINKENIILSLNEDKIKLEEHIKKDKEEIKVLHHDYKEKIEKELKNALDLKAEITKRDKSLLQAKKEHEEKVYDLENIIDGKNDNITKLDENIISLDNIILLKKEEITEHINAFDDQKKMHSNVIQDASKKIIVLESNNISQTLEYKEKIDAFTEENNKLKENKTYLEKEVQEKSLSIARHLKIQKDMIIQTNEERENHEKALESKDKVFTSFRNEQENKIAKLNEMYQKSVDELNEKIKLSNEEHLKVEQSYIESATVDKKEIENLKVEQSLLHKKIKDKEILVQKLENTQEAFILQSEKNQKNHEKILKSKEKTYQLVLEEKENSLLSQRNIHQSAMVEIQKRTALLESKYLTDKAHNEDLNNKYKKEISMLELIQLKLEKEMLLKEEEKEVLLFNAKEHVNKILILQEENIKEKSASKDINKQYKDKNLILESKQVELEKEIHLKEEENKILQLNDQKNARRIDLLEEEIIKEKTYINVIDKNYKNEIDRLETKKTRLEKQLLINEAEKDMLLDKEREDLKSINILKEKIAEQIFSLERLKKDNQIIQEKKEAFELKAKSIKSMAHLDATLNDKEKVIVELQNTQERLLQDIENNKLFLDKKQLSFDTSIMSLNKVHDEIINEYTNNLRNLEKNVIQKDKIMEELRESEKKYIYDIKSLTQMIDEKTKMITNIRLENEAIKKLSNNQEVIKRIHAGESKESISESLSLPMNRIELIMKFEKAKKDKMNTE